MRPRLGNLHPFVGQDISSLIALRAETLPDKPFMIWEPFHGEGLTWTYRAFADKVARFAAGLHKRGVRPNERVLVHLDNCPEAILAWFGCAAMGATAVTTNARSSGDELSYYAETSGAVVAITQPRFAELVARSCRNVRWLAVTKTDNGEAAGAARPEPAVGFDRIDDEPANAPRRAHDPLAPFSIQFTSGTTSRPKAVLWTHANALWGAKVCADHEDLRPGDVHLVTMPLFHTNAQCYSVLATLWAGATCVVQPRFSASRFWPISLKHGCTWASMVPFCVRALMAHEVPAHSYRLWGSGVCDPPTDSHFHVRTIGWWGMTETITHGTVGHADKPNVAMSMGRCAAEYELKLIDDDGRELGAGDTGNFLIRGIPGLSLFAEYAGNPKATQESFTDDGYFITGDRVTLREDGYFVFEDRAKDMLKVGGENVAASEVERVLMTVPGIAEVAVVAKKHEMLDEVPVAFVMPLGGLKGAPPNLADEVMAACRAQLADFKVPREIRIIDDFPRSTLEKIAKAELRKMLAAEGKLADKPRAKASV